VYQPLDFYSILTFDSSIVCCRYGIALKQSGGNMQKPRLLDQVPSVIRVRHYSRRTGAQPRDF
jgi:hypothetical protein